MTAQEYLASGLIDLRNSWAYKETRRKNPTIFSQTKLGIAEAKFMHASPTRQIVNDGLRLYRESWAYLKTKDLNPDPSAFARTLIAKAEAKFVKARDLLPDASLGLGIFATPGFFCLDPHGGVEEADTYKAAGFKWGAANVGDFLQEEWDVWRQKMQSVGLDTIPWRRCYTPAMSDHLCGVGVAWNSTWVVHNVEKEAESTNTPQQVAGVVDAYPQLRHAVQTESWLQNGIGWQVLGNRSVVALPECYMNMDPRWEPAVCVGHAHDEGMPLAVPTFGWGLWGDAHYDIPPERYLSLWAGTAWSVYHMLTSDHAEIMRWKR